MAYNERINDTTLNAKYKDGQILHHTDMNEIVSVLKEGINANYDDIQGLENGDISSGNAKKIDGSSISRYLDETLKDDDNKIPSSQQVKQYVDAKFNNVNPKKGVDYWTPSDKSEIANDVVNIIIPDANNEFNKNVTAKTEAFNENASDKTTDFNNNANTKTNNFNTNATTKTSAYDNNADEKLTAYNKNDTEKLNAYNSNASSKISDFNTNSTAKSTSYNNNASEKLNSFNSNSILKVKEFNNNATAKTTTFNENASAQQISFNSNAIEKTNEFNKNATEYFETYKAELKGEKGEKGEKGDTVTYKAGTDIEITEDNIINYIGSGGGTGNVSSDIVNSILVVNKLPASEVEGVLYLVKESGSSGETPSGTNIFTNYTSFTDYYLNSSGIIKSLTGGYSYYVSCEANTTYTVNGVGNKLLAGAFSSVPISGISTTNFVTNDGGSTLNITTGADEIYLFVYLGTADATLTEEQIIAGCTIIKN